MNIHFHKIQNIHSIKLIIFFKIQNIYSNKIFIFFKIGCIEQGYIWWARAAQKWPILVQFWTKNDQTWQAWLFSKGSKMAYLKPILLPFWTIFCPFGPSWPGKHKVYALKQIIIFLEYEEKTFLFVPLGQPYGFQFIPPLISNRGWIMVRLFAVSGLPKFCTFFHFPPSSTRQRRDISTFPDNLMV